MKEPTQAQIKVFWEGYGFEDLDGSGWSYRIGQWNNIYYGHKLPPIDLNSLFKYVPKEWAIVIRPICDAYFSEVGIVNIFTGKEIHNRVEWNDENINYRIALALFWALDKVREVVMTDKLTAEEIYKLHPWLEDGRCLECSIVTCKSHLAKVDKPDRPKIICLCGSTRFKDAFTDAQLRETLAGKIVLTIGCNMKSDTEIFGHLTKPELNDIKVKLDELHKRKIDLADEVLILNVGGYIGDSTRSELNYAKQLSKKITYLEADNG